MSSLPQESMAVTGQEALYEEESSDVEGSYDHEGDEDQDVSALGSLSSSSLSSTQSLADEFNRLAELQKRISETNPSSILGGSPLSQEAFMVLSRASMSLLNLRKQTKLDSGLVAPLYTQLESLNKLIPQPTQEAAGERSSSCVVTSALEYLERLRKEIGTLRDGMQEPSTLKGGSFSKETQDYEGTIDVLRSSEARLHIHVHCKKRKGLLTNLILALEIQGFIFDQVDVSCNDFMIMLDAITTQDSVKMTNEETVRQLLRRIIHKNQK